MDLLHGVRPEASDAVRSGYSGEGNQKRHVHDGQADAELTILRVKGDRRRILRNR